MTIQPLDEERIFHAARLLPSDEAVSDDLDQICAGNQTLRGWVKAYSPGSLTWNQPNRAKVDFTTFGLQGDLSGDDVTTARLVDFFAVNEH